MILVLVFCLLKGGSCRTRRAILDDFDLLPADLVQDEPQSEKVMDWMPSFRHLDGGFSETLEVELDNAEARRRRQKKREIDPILAGLLASPVKEEPVRRCRGGHHKVVVHEPIAARSIMKPTNEWSIPKKMTHSKS